MSRFRKITGHVYNVENQNGFNNALYDFYGASDDCDNCRYSKKRVRGMVENYPKIYPRTIVIIDKVFECGKIHIEDFDLDEESHLYKF